METQEGFAPLSAQHLDPEVFRRVWARVMPDQKDCPIVVDPPTRSQPHRPSPAPQASRPTPAPSIKEESPSLTDLLEQLRAGVLQAQALVRRTGGNRALSQLSASRQQAMRQLSASHFLASGRRFQSNSPVPAPPVDLPQALRGQFLWEQRWARDCLAAAGHTDDPALAKLLQALAAGAQPRLRIIRTLLEHM